MSISLFGRVREFHSYASKIIKQGDLDSNESARIQVQLNDPDVIDAGKKVRQFFDYQSTGLKLNSIFAVFALTTSKPSSAGDNYSISAR